MHDKAFDIGNNSKYDGYQHGLTSIPYKKTSGSGIKNEKKNVLLIFLVNIPGLFLPKIKKVLQK